MIYAAIFFAGFVVGSIVTFLLRDRIARYAGAIQVSSDDPDKTVYSLVLYGLPEELMHKKSVRFKIEKSEEL